MGREVKRVPLDFDHQGIWPGYEFHCNCENFTPSDEFPDECSNGFDLCQNHYDPPQGEGWQLWENVSEGSPVTPVFATKGELVEHLVRHGAGGAFEHISRQAAENLCSSGWCPSGVVAGGQFMNGADGMLVLDRLAEKGRRG